MEKKNNQFCPEKVHAPLSVICWFRGISEKMLFVSLKQVAVKSRTAGA
jgi:hypothetical protein